MCGLCDPCSFGGGFGCGVHKFILEDRGKVFGKIKKPLDCSRGLEGVHVLSQRRHVFRLQAFRSLLYFKFNLLAFV